MTSEGNVEVNRSGSFFLPPQGPPGPYQRNWAGGLFPGGTSQARKFIFVHEIAHLTDVILPDPNSWVQQEANNSEILKNCQKALGIR